ncbi:hypothetical protein DFH09DRAFT_1170205, partial [Mycena vulgaris]
MFPYIRIHPSRLFAVPSSRFTSHLALVSRPPCHHLLWASHPLRLPIVVSHPHRCHTPPLSSVWPRRFLRPYLPSSPPLVGHSPSHPVFIFTSIHFVRPLSRPLVLFIHTPIHCPLSPRPPHLHSSPSLSHLEHAVALPCSAHARARASSLAAYFRCRSHSCVSHPSTHRPLIIIPRSSHPFLPGRVVSPHAPIPTAPHSQC